MVTTDDMLQAYYDCRKRKRRTASAVVYEMDYEARLIALRDRINTRQYAPGKSICFVVTRPRYREVFAASFEDRIVHHYIALRLEPLFEQIFSPRTFNCRKGKGQLYGIKMLENDLRTVSQNYTRSCWVLKLDLKGFFMSIDRKMLACTKRRLPAKRPSSSPPNTPPPNYNTGIPTDFVIPTDSVIPTYRLCHSDRA